MSMVAESRSPIRFAKVGPTSVDLDQVNRELASVTRQLAEARADLELASELNPELWLHAERTVRRIELRAAALAHLKAKISAYRRDLARSEEQRQRNILRMKNSDRRIH